MEYVYVVMRGEIGEGGEILRVYRELDAAMKRAAAEWSRPNFARCDWVDVFRCGVK